MSALRRFVALRADVAVSFARVRFVVGVFVCFCDAGDACCCCKSELFDASEPVALATDERDDVDVFVAAAVATRAAGKRPADESDGIAWSKADACAARRGDWCGLMSNFRTMR